MKVELVQRAQRPMPLFVFGRIEVTYKLRITITGDKKTP